MSIGSSGNAGCGVCLSCWVVVVKGPRGRWVGGTW